MQHGHKYLKMWMGFYLYIRVKTYQGTHFLSEHLSCQMLGGGDVDIDDHDVVCS